MWVLSREFSVLLSWWVASHQRGALRCDPDPRRGLASRPPFFRPERRACGPLARRARARAPRRPVDRHRDLPHSTRGHPTGVNRDGRLLSEPERRPFKRCLHEARRPNPRRGRPPRGRAHGPVRPSRASVLGPMIECRCADSEHCAATFSRGHPSTEAEGLTMRRPQGSRRLSLAAAAAAAAAQRACGPVSYTHLRAPHT